ncbi:hypothetical protein Tco_1117146 [Tanacetum coccineum]
MKNICITIHHEGTFAYNPFSYEYGDVDVVENVNLGNCNYERLMKIVKECCLFPVHDMYFCAFKVDIVEHHGYDVMADGELEMEDVSEYVGLDYIGEEDVEIPNTRLNDTFLNKLVDGKFISDKDFRAKVDTQSISSRNVDDSSMDDRFELWDYKDDILSTNPGSSVQLDVDTMDDGETQFKRMYIYLKGVLLNLHFSPCLLELNIKIVHLSSIVTITDLKIKKVVESALAA